MSYPNAVETFTDPAATDPVNSPSHSDLHKRTNDTVEALQNRLGTGSDSTPGASNQVLRSTSVTASQWAPLALATDTSGSLSLRTQVAGSLSIDMVSGFSTFPIPASSTVFGIYTPWTAYTPTLSGTTGTWGTTTIVLARWKQLGKTVWFQVTAYGTTSGACTDLRFTLPSTPANTGANAVGGSCRIFDLQWSAAAWEWFNADSNCRVTKNGEVVFNDGASKYVSVQGFYEVA